MHKSEISEEILSKIKIEIKDTLFYMPGETLKGTIKLYPGIKFNIKNNILNFKIKLVQYEFWEYNNIKLKELKNVYKTEIKENNIKYILKKGENYDIKERIKIGDFSMVLIEKENKEKKIAVPFEFKIDEQSENEKMLPTFQYETNKYFLGIRHLLEVENIEYSARNYIGLFIGKSRNIKSSTKEIINNHNSWFNTLNTKVIFEKESYAFGEEMKFKMETNSNLLFKKVTKIEPEIYRKIEWIGYMKNSLIEKKNLPCDDFNYNEDKHCIMSKLLLPQRIVELKENYDNLKNEGIGISGFFGIFDLIAELYHCYDTLKEILRLDAEKNKFKEDIKVVSKFNKSIMKSKKEEKELKKISEELKKFIYFKDNKVAGFVKFITDITPPVNGYYFKCYYNFKINVHISGIIADQDKSFKNNMDFYDGNEYVKKMKKILKC